MKQLFVVLSLAILLMACTPMEAATQVTATGNEQTPANEEKAAPAAPEAGVSSSIGGKAPTQGGLQPTGNTKNFVLTVTSDGYSTKVLTVIPGDRIKLTIVNEDSKEHSFALPDFGVTTAVAADASGLVDFTPLKKGEFPWNDNGVKAGTLIVGGST